MNRSNEKNRIPKMLNLYAALMEEVKIRIDVIKIIVGTTPVPMPSTLMREYCFLQLRMICELIALGCLTAHGEIEESAPRYARTMQRTR